MSETPKPFNEKSVYVPRKKGLGLGDWIIDKIGVRPATWKLLRKVFKAFIAGSKYIETPIIGPIYKAAMMLTPDEKRYSGGTVYNLNVDLSSKGESVVVPMDLVKDVLRKTSYIASMNACLCRDASNCQHYPKDVCCLFTSNAGRTIVDHKVGYEISLEDALAQVDKAAELGLIAQTLFLEIEQFVWGFSNATMEHFIAICFCCPCCCGVLQAFKHANRTVKRRIHPSGWQATMNANACIGCGACIKPCAQTAITLDDESKAVVNQEYCVGCGICKTHCKMDAISIKQTRPMLGSVQEYFLVNNRLELKIDT